METNKLSVKDSSISWLIGFLLSQLGVIIATCITFIVFRICKLNMDNLIPFMNTAIGYILTALSLYTVMLLVFLYYNRNKENKITKKLELKKVLFYIGLACISFVTLYPIVICVDSLISKCGIKINTLPYALTTKNYFISFISLVIAPAICEELLFRGLIFSGLKKFGKSFSIFTTALMFSIFHMSISQTVYPLLMGMLFSVIMYYEQNIYYCIIAHAVNNFISLTLSYFNINLIFNHWTYILLAIVLCALFVATILYFSLKNNKETKKQNLTKTDKIYLLSIMVIMILFWILINFI